MECGILKPKRQYQPPGRDGRSMKTPAPRVMGVAVDPAKLDADKTWAEKYLVDIHGLIPDPSGTQHLGDIAMEGPVFRQAVLNAANPKAEDTLDIDMEKFNLIWPVQLRTLSRLDLNPFNAIGPSRTGHSIAAVTALKSSLWKGHGRKKGLLKSARHNITTTV